ncbi:Fic/DOC family N-terminal domain-containing protein [Undibacterium sp. Xuan67W]|uniref:Fic/DOC family N-terminal domain-containing protein n=1 Tax=Undibacterium sp. Xuan67W TaxID=3413057 RepID=UPI003BF1509A
MHLPISKKPATASRKLAKLKGINASPESGNPRRYLVIEEAKDRSAIENIITTHDEPFKNDVLPKAFANPANM